MSQKKKKTSWLEELHDCNFTYLWFDSAGLETVEQNIY